MISGGAGSHDLVRQILADATGLPVVATKADEPVLLGSAILGAVAGGVYTDVPQAMAAMSRAEQTFTPAGGAIQTLHAARFAAFQALQQVARAIRKP
ncbi:MAG: FGGY-family carbohydrate kinase, partial [Paracoccaceae bacterium]